MSSSTVAATAAPNLPTTTAESVASSTTTTAALKDKDRPRRRKARRACHACQRAHLTCGDERPCQRCIKRGLQDACHDGVRKKAKYLHDAPGDDPSADRNHPSALNFRQQRPQVSTQMQGSYDHSPISPMNPHPSPGVPQPHSAMSTSSFMDSHDPWFNLDVNGVEFGSRFGALEFGALGHMSSLVSNENGAQPFSGASYNPQTQGFPMGFSQDDMAAAGWNGSRNNSTGGMVPGSMPNFPNTYTIAAGPSALTSPSPPAPSPQAGGSSLQSAGQSPAMYDMVPPSTNNVSQAPGPGQGQGFYRPHAPPQGPSYGAFQKPQPAYQGGLLRRAKTTSDPANIYTNVTKPYAYPAGFHRLFHLIETRFPKQSIMRIARSLASFRPSFIACTQALKEADLVFMEKCFQRTLWEYERFIQLCGTPTIVFRRTGEVAAVGKEFCILTGWSKEVLLGEKPNLNTNYTGYGKDDVLTADRNIATPSDDDTAHNSPKPVFLAELLDEESVVRFYAEFAKMAFGDSRGAVRTQCKIMTYREQPIKSETREESTQAGKIATKDGKLRCTFCWTIKRDVFDIPMLIVANFLPILESPGVQEP